MDANDAVLEVGAQLEEARDAGTMCARLVLRDGKILIVGEAAVQDSDLSIGHLSSKDLWHGPSVPKWKHIEDRIRDLILKGLL